MLRQTTRFSSIIGLFAVSFLMEAQSLIDLSSATDIANRRPILIAHRGGVITPSSPECSLSAIRIAGQTGYDMVELDVRMSKDGVPIVFHDRTLESACGRSESISDLAAAELLTIRYLKGGDHIVTFETALQECRKQNLGIMLDLKAGRDNAQFLTTLDQLILKTGYENATITISGTESTRLHLKHVRFTPTKAEIQQLREKQDTNLQDRFWFGLPQQLPNSDIHLFKKSGALIFPAINTFRYPKSNHLELAKKDIRRLLDNGVDGFQLDSIYHKLIKPSTP
jgi:glycerophosphoryl diester phosphodiesterase